MGTVTTVFIIFMFGIFILIVGLVIHQRRKDMKATLGVIQEDAPTTTSFDVQRNAAWITYRGVVVPLYLYEIPTWNYVPVEAKNAWIAKIKEEIKSGKRIAIKDEAKKIQGYRVTDKKLIDIEFAKAEINKKVITA